MRGRSRALWTGVLTLTAMLTVVPAAGAYIDPGSTTMIFQAVVAALAAAGMTLKIGWSRIKAFFTRSEAVTESDSQAVEDT